MMNLLEWVVMSRKLKVKKTMDELLQEALVPEEEQPYEVPENWVWVKFGTVAKLINGYAYKSSDYVEQGIPVVRISDIKNLIINLTQAVKVPTDLYNEKFIISHGDLLIAMSGATTGKTGIFIANEKALQNQRVGNIKEVDNRLLVRGYKNYFIKKSKNQILKLAYGGAQPNISGKMIEDIDFPLPSLNEQKRIANKVERLLNKIDQAKQLIEEAKETFELRRAAILDKAFRGELTAKWREENPEVESADQWIDKLKNTKQSLKKKKETTLGQLDEPYLLPFNWKWISISELGELSRGKSKHRPRNDEKLFGGSYPFIQTGDVARAVDYIRDYKQTLSEFGYNQSKLFPEDTVCITIAANIADTAILKFPCCFPDSVVGFNAYQGSVSPEYIHYYLTTIKSNIEQYAPATAQKNINLKILNEIMVPLPPKKEHDHVMSLINQMLEKNDHANKYSCVEENLDNLKQSILSKAFRGELGTNDPTEESAIELLKEVLQEQLQ